MFYDIEHFMKDKTISYGKMVMYLSLCCLIGDQEIVIHVHCICYISSFTSHHRTHHHPCILCSNSDFGVTVANKEYVVYVAFNSNNFFNYFSPKWRWLVVDIYQAKKRQGKYPPLATDTKTVLKNDDLELIYSCQQ